MRTIIAGSRGIQESEALLLIEQYPFPISEVICGCADGVDMAGFEWARSYNTPVRFYPAWFGQMLWAKARCKNSEKMIWPNGGYAGPIRTHGMKRNYEMAKYAEALLLIHLDPITPGSAGMLRDAQRLGLQIQRFAVKR